MSIELRLSDIDPPAEEPKRTIYRDIVNLPDPVKLGITIRYFNHDDVGLYFRITGSGTGYTFGTVNLNGGAVLGSGLDKYENLDEFASRAKPSAGDLPNGEKEEYITLILKAYTDSGYTNLKWTFERVVTVHWINSADAAFTVDFLNNFDDGTVDGWAAKTLIGDTYNVPAISCAIATDYVLSPPYSLKAISVVTWSSPYINTIYPKNIQITSDGTSLILLGRPYDLVYAAYIVKDKWLRVVIPLPKNTTAELRITWSAYSNESGYSAAREEACLYKTFTTLNKDTIYLIADIRISHDSASSNRIYFYCWLDDFKLISK